MIQSKTIQDFIFLINNNAKGSYKISKWNQYIRIVQTREEEVNFAGLEG